MRQTTIKKFRGDTIIVPITIDLSVSASYRAQCRKTPESTEYFTIAVDTVSKLITITSDQSENMEEGSWYVELEENESGIITTLQRDLILIKNDVTRTYGEPAPEWETEQSVEVAEMISKTFYIRDELGGLTPIDLAQTNLDIEANTLLANNIAFANFKASLAKYDSSLVAYGLAKAGDLAPTAVLNRAYMAVDDGTIFGIQNVKKGDYLTCRDVSTGYTVETLDEDLKTHATRLTGITETTIEKEAYFNPDDNYEIIDSEGNVLARFDSSGLQVIAAVIASISSTDSTITTATITKTLTDLVQSDSFKLKNLNNDEILAAVSGYIAHLISADPDINIADKEGNVVFKIDSDGLAALVNYLKSDSFKLKNADDQDVMSLVNGVIEHLMADGDFYITDAEGNVVFKIDSDGVDFAGKTSGTTTATGIKEGNLLADIIQCIVYGQSLATGGSLYSAIDFYDAIMFSGGVLTNYDPDDTAARDAYYAGGLVDLATTGTETPIKGFARAFKDALVQMNNLPLDKQDFKLLVNAPGTGGASLGQLAWQTGDEYRRLIESVQYAHDLAMAQGKSHAVGFILWWQGENSGNVVMTPSEYKTAMLAMFDNLNTDIKAITGQTEDVHFITYQTAYFYANASYTGTKGPTYAQLQAALERDNVSLAPAIYPYSTSDVVHLVSQYYRVAGAAAAFTAVRSVVNKEKQNPMFPSNWTVSQNSAGTSWMIDIEIPNVNYPPLILDTPFAIIDNDPDSSVPTNYGFSILNGSESEIITAVSVVRRNHIVITCSENPTGLVMTYCDKGLVEPGYVRDSMGDNYTIFANSINYRVDNWLPIFEITI